jgi:hypothetical protein
VARAGSNRWLVPPTAVSPDRWKNPGRCFGWKRNWDPAKPSELPGINISSARKTSRACSFSLFRRGLWLLKFSAVQFLFRWLMISFPSPVPNTSQTHDDAWLVVCRWRQYAAEIRVNVLRICAIAMFYLLHLAGSWPGNAGSWLSLLQFNQTRELSPQRHLAITVLVGAWVLWSLTVHVLLLDRVFPRRLPVLSICLDSLFLTAVLICGSGAASPLVCGYFLIVMMAGLRLNLSWVRLATGCCVLGYLVVLGCSRWPQGFLLQDPLPTVPRYHQIMVCLAIVISGVIVGQMVRHVRQIAEDLLRISLAERQP